MGKLIVDGNCVYEIDEDCLKNRWVPEGCEVYEAFERARRAEALRDRTDNEKIAER